MSNSKNGNEGFEIGMVSHMKKIQSFTSAFAKGLQALWNAKQFNSKLVVEFGYAVKFLFVVRLNMYVG